MSALSGSAPHPRIPESWIARGEQRSKAVVPPVQHLAAYAALTDTPLLVVSVTEQEPLPVVRWANRAFTELFGYDVDEVVGEPLWLLEHSPLGAGGDDVEAGPDELLRERRTSAATCTLERKDGTRFVSEVTAVPVGSFDGASWVLRIRPSGEKLWADDHLRASEERFRALTDGAPIGIFSSDVGLRLGYVNDFFAELHGTSADDLLGTAWLGLVHPEDVGEAIAAIEMVLGGESVDLPLRICPADQSPRWVHMRAVPVRTPGKGAGFVGTLEDVTQRRAWEATLAHQASHDPLTGLPNRVQLWETLSKVLEGRRANDPAVALLFFDLDNFKLVNDSLGHDAGDMLLVEISRRLGAAVRQGDLVTRFGGDEFVVLCQGVENEQEAGVIAARLLEALTGPVQLEGTEVRVSASVGVVLADESYNAPESLVRDADVAMYQAKGAGKDCYAMFDQRVRDDLQHRLRLTNDLRRAVDNDEMWLAYQPVVELVTGSVRSVEALLRWSHPEHGEISPADFIPLAEETNLIVTLGAWVLQQACNQLADWRRTMGADAPRYVAVNLSALQLDQATLPEIVEDALRSADLCGDDLCLELTESVLMADPEVSLASLGRLRDLGVRFAIDDFGTGYSSFTYLRRLPVDYLKIDRSFTAGLGLAGEDAIVAAVVSLAQALGLAAVAEGVETQEQAEELTRMGCAYAQGFYFGRPVAPAVLPTLLASLRELPALSSISEIAS